MKIVSDTNLKVNFIEKSKFISGALDFVHITAKSFDDLHSQIKWSIDEF
jgi:hypothetical protein